MESRDLVFYNVERRPDLAGRLRSRIERLVCSDVAATGTVTGTVALRKEGSRWGWEMLCANLVCKNSAVPLGLDLLFYDSPALKGWAGLFSVVPLGTSGTADTGRLLSKEFKKMFRECNH
jgi:hypothetical protein